MTKIRCAAGTDLSGRRVAGGAIDFARGRFGRRRGGSLSVPENVLQTVGALQAGQIGDQIVAALIAKKPRVARHGGVVAEQSWVDEMNVQPQGRAARADFTEVRPLAAVADEGDVRGG